MPGAVRAVLDTTFGSGTHGLDCCGHSFGGIHIEGSNNVFINDLKAVRVNDLTNHYCPHCGIGISETGSENVFINGIAAHRKGDAINEICGSGITTSGSDNVIVNGD